MNLTIYKNEAVIKRIHLHASFFHLVKQNGKVLTPSDKAHNIMHDSRGNGFILSQKEKVIQKWGKIAKEKQ